MITITQSTYCKLSKTLTLFTLAAFIVNAALGDYANAGVSQVSTSHLFGVSDRVSAENQLFSVGTAILPSDLGVIDAKWSPGEAAGGEPQTMVIHIQDAHCDYGAELSIAKIVGYLNKTYGVNVVGLEGGAGPYDFSPFTRISDNSLREKTADSFMRDGELNGAEYYAIMNPGKIEVSGVEATDLYLKDLDACHSILEENSSINGVLKRIYPYLDSLKERFFDTKLAEFYKRRGDFKDLNIPIGDYIAFLLATSARMDISVTAYREVLAMDEVFRMEKEIDFPEAARQRNEFIERLARDLSLQEVKDLKDKAEVLSSGEIGLVEYYDYLAGKADCIGMDVNEFPGFNMYMFYLKRYLAVDRKELLAQISSMENVIETRLALTRQQKKLLSTLKAFDIIRGMMNMRLSKTDYVHYMGHKDDFDASNIFSFIRENTDTHYSAKKLSGDTEALNGYVRKMERFYEYSFRRDKAFVENIMSVGSDKRGTPQARRVVILITGGFHTENLTSLLREENISYVSIIPKFDNHPARENRYLKIIGEGLSKEVFDGILETESSVIAIASLNSELGEIARGKRLYSFDVAARALGIKVSEAPARQGNKKTGQVRIEGSPSLLIGAGAAAALTILFMMMVVPQLYYGLPHIVKGFLQMPDILNFHYIPIEWHVKEVLSTVSYGAMVFGGGMFGKPFITEEDDAEPHIVLYPSPDKHFGNHTERLLRTLPIDEMESLVDNAGEYSRKMTGQKLTGIWIADDVDRELMRQFVQNKGSELIVFRVNEGWDHRLDRPLATLDITLSDKGREIRHLAVAALSQDYGVREAARTRAEEERDQNKDRYGVYYSIVKNYEAAATAIRSIWHTKGNDVDKDLTVIIGNYYVVGRCISGISKEIVRYEISRSKDSRGTALEMWRIQEEEELLLDAVDILQKRTKKESALLLSLHNTLLSKQVEAYDDLAEYELWVEELEGVEERVAELDISFKRLYRRIDDFTRKRPIEGDAAHKVIEETLEDSMRTITERFSDMRAVLRTQIDFAQGGIINKRAKVRNLVHGIEEGISAWFPGKVHFGQVSRDVLETMVMVNDSVIKASIWNLVKNSFDNGALKVSLRISINDREDLHGKKRRYLSIDIEDDGPGISDFLLKDGALLHRKTLFDLNATARKGGTGLGLNEVWQSVVAHDGLVNVETTRGKNDHGTRFILDLPIISSEAEEGHAGPGSANPMTLRRPDPEDRARVVHDGVAVERPFLPADSKKETPPARYSETLEGFRDFVRGIKSTVRFRGEKMIILMPEVPPRIGEDAAETRKRRAFMKRMSEEYGVNDIVVRYYDPGENADTRSIFSRLVGDMGERSHALIYVPEERYTEIVADGGRIIGDDEAVGRVHYVKENFASGFVQELIAIHIILGVGLLDLARGAVAEGDSNRLALVNHVADVIYALGDIKTASDIRRNWRDMFNGRVTLTIPYSAAVEEDLLAREKVAVAA